MESKEMLARFGLSPTPNLMPELRRVLEDLLVSPVDDEDVGLDDRVKLACVQLFHAGDLSDVLRIWRAKQASFDNFLGIDVQLLCGAGLAATKEYLQVLGGDEAQRALAYLEECEGSGDFADFDPVSYKAFWARHYSASA